MRFLLLLFLFATLAYCNRIHVSPSGQSSISRAMLSARAGDTIVLADGKYHEEVRINSGVVLYSPNIFGAQIIGNGRNPVVTLSSNSKISGVVISGGQNGIVSKNSGASIENCWIHSNRGSGILAIGRLPGITNSIISNNLNSGIQATQIGSTEGELRHLTIADNRQNGIDIDGDQNILLIDCLFFRNGNRAIKTPNTDLISVSNTLIFPEQREFANHPDLAARPFFTGKHYKLRDNSTGRNKATNGQDIGFNK